MADRWTVLCCGAMSLASGWLISSGITGCGTDDESPGLTTTTVQPPDGGTGGGGGGVTIDINLDGLSAPVTVTIDDQGVKHLLCATDEDCLAAYGYIISRDLFMVMDAIRRSSRGRWAEVDPSMQAVETDATQRHFLSTADGTPLEEAVWEKLSAPTQGLIQAYVNGINAWIADLQANRNDARVSAEYQQAVPNLMDHLVPWEPLDVIAILLSGEQGETGDGLAPELSHSDLLDSAGPDLYRDLVLGLPASPESIIPPELLSLQSPGAAAGTNGAASLEPHLTVLAKARSRLAARLPLMRKISEARRQQARLRDFVPRPNASNNWAVGSSRTAHGGSLVESDPHGPLQFPTHMYLIELDSKSAGTGSLHVMGTGLGDPAFYIGRNEDIAWGLTTSCADLIDYYEETLVQDGTAVLFQGQEVPLIEKTITIQRTNGQTAERTLQWVPHHGPLLATDGTQGVSVRWVGHDANTDIEAWFDLMRAPDAEAALVAARKFEARGNNLVIGDRQGHVAWRPMIRVPSRPWADQLPPYLPLPGDGSAEWDGYLSEDEHYELYDPPQGYVASSNNDFTGAWYDGDPTNDGLPYMQFFVSEGSRAARIAEVLDGSTTHDQHSMIALQHDSTMWMGSELVPDILTLAQQSEGQLTTEGEATRDALAAWQYTCPTGLSGNLPSSPDDPDTTQGTESVGCTAYHATMMALSDLIVLDDCDSAGVTCAENRLRNKLLHALLKRPEALATGETLWDDGDTPQVETPSDVVAQALNQAGGDLTQLQGADTNQWRWGRVLTFVPTPMVNTGASYLTHGPYSVNGGMISVNVVSPQVFAGGYRHSYGAMLRMVVDFAPGLTTDHWQIPGGIEHHSDSPYYDHLFDHYVNETPFIPPFGPAATAAAATDVIVLGSKP